MLPTNFVPYILLVDSNSVLRRLTALAIVNQGFKVATAATSENAAKLIKENEFDVVITDIDLPEMSGEQLFNIIRTSYRELKVIIIKDRHSEDEYFLLRGALETLCKPFSNKELAGKLDMVLKERRRSIRYKTQDIFCRLKSGSGNGGVEGILNNISFDGALIDTSQDLEERKDLEVEFTSPDTGETIGTARGKIMRINQSVNEVRYQVGEYFEGSKTLLDLFEHLAPYIRDKAD